MCVLPVKSYDQGMEREDLGALFARVTRRLIDAERPLLTDHGLSMWGYIVLSRLARRPAATQLALANAIGYDKTRLIALLDELERDGLIIREPDPADRRAHTVRLTPEGEVRHAAAQADVRVMEAELLGDLSATERSSLLAVLPRLAEPRSR
jgi:DNA-binding MarR family transcriptional regulator